jgi:hypothetical protein
MVCVWRSGLGRLPKLLLCVNKDHKTWLSLVQNRKKSKVIHARSYSVVAGDIGPNELLH